MKKYLFGTLLALLSLSAVADLQNSQSNGDVVVLHGAVCTNPIVLAHIPAQFRGEFMAAEATVGKVHYDACFRNSGKLVHLIYEDGDQGLVPTTEFKEMGV